MTSGVRACIRALLPVVAIAVLLGPPLAAAHGPTVRLSYAGVRPARLVLVVGQTVHFLNANSGPGTCTLIAEGGAFEARPLERGKGWHHTFEAEGSFSFFVEEFPSARGEIVVVKQSGLRFDELLTDTSGLPEPASFVARDAARLPYRLYPARSDLHLILVHGSGWHSTYLFPLARALSAENLANVYTPDLRGHGTDPERRGDIDYVDQLEDDLADLIAHVLRMNPEAGVAIGGHSSGGGLALRFAGGPYADQTSAVLLLAPFLRHDAPTTRPNAGGWARPRVGRIAALDVLNAVGIQALNGLEVIEFDLPEPFRDGTETLHYTYRLNTGFAPRSYESELAAIRVPLLVLVGSEDEAFLPDRFPTTISQYAPRADVRILEGVSHMGVVVGSQARSVIAEWLRTL